jgi:hypothetical protein
LEAHKYGVSSEPDINRIPLGRFTRALLLLCSDGVWEFISSSEAIQLAAECTTPMDGAARLVEVAHERWERMGKYCDDITAVLVRLRPDIERLPTDLAAPQAVPQVVNGSGATEQSPVRVSPKTGASAFNSAEEFSPAATAAALAGVDANGNPLTGTRTGGELPSGSRTETLRTETTSEGSETCSEISRKDPCAQVGPAERTETFAEVQDTGEPSARTTQEQVGPAERTETFAEVEVSIQGSKETPANA